MRVGSLSRKGKEERYRREVRELVPFPMPCLSVLVCLPVPLYLCGLFMSRGVASPVGVSGRLMCAQEFVQGLPHPPIGLLVR